MDIASKAQRDVRNHNKTISDFAQCWRKRWQSFHRPEKQSARTGSLNDKASLHSYFNSLSEYSTTPLWTNMHKMLPPQPNPKAIITSWQYAKMRPAMMKAAEIVTAEEAERRVLVLVNKTLATLYTTDSVYAGL